MRLNNKGLTIIETILSFTLAMIIILGMFNVILNFKDKSETEVLRTDYLTLKNVVTKDIEKEIIDKKVELINTNCGGISNCVNIVFKDRTNKYLYINTTDVRNKYIQYGDQKYEIFDDIPTNIPTDKSINDFQNIKINTSNVLTTKTANSKTVYTINFGINHVDLYDDFGIYIVTYK